MEKMRMFFRLWSLVFILLLYPLLSYSARTYLISNEKELINTLRIVADGDSIVVKPGRYLVDSLVIRRSISLIGINFPEIIGNKRDEVITIRANGVLVKGLKVKNAGISFLRENVAIRFEEVNGGVAEGNILDSNFFGIYISKSQNCVVKNNVIVAYNRTETFSGNGIHLWYSKNITIIGNKIQGHRDGIYFEFVKHALVKGNYSKDNLRYGLHFMFSDSCGYIENTFESNGAGIAVMYTKNVTIKSNRFINNWGSASFGLLLKELTNCLIENNHFEKNTNGLYLEGSNRITVKRNNFIRNGWAIKLMENSMENYFTDNNFVGNSFDVLSNNRTTYNTFFRNYWSRYTGFDLNRDGYGDVPYRPVSFFSIIVERQPNALVLLHSLFVGLLNFAESIIPSLTLMNLFDPEPRIKSFPISLS